MSEPSDILKSSKNANENARLNDNEPFTYEALSERFKDAFPKLSAIYAALSPEEQDRWKALSARTYQGLMEATPIELKQRVLELKDDAWKKHPEFFLALMQAARQKLVTDPDPLL